MIRAIVFDFGKVVAFFDHRRVTQRLAAHGDYDPDDFHAFLWGGTLEDDYEAGRITSQEFLLRVRDKGRLRCSDEVLISTYADIFWPNPDIAALLPRLKPRYRLLLASNTSELHSRHFREQFSETLQNFDGLVLSHEIGARKPTSEFFEHCQCRADCLPDECVFIDDLPANVDGARACGWHGIVYSGIDDLLSGLASLGVELGPTK